MNRRVSTPRATLLWNLLAEGVHTFSQALAGKHLGIFWPVDKNVEKPQNPFWQLNAGDAWPKKYLPIRGFRTTEPLFVDRQNLCLSFLSSGTTSGPEGRSKSGFSSDGAELYRLASLKSFSDMLNLCVGDNASIAGVSLIPPISEWPDSSLARMVHWISKVWDVRYANYLAPDSIEEAIDKASQGGKKPVFIFGTAFHLIDLLDIGATFNLPEKSIIIETGGTKGRTRSVTRPELYDLICQGFKISENRIVSEYGMCELASQAYDFLPPGSDTKLDDRRFRFPWWSPVKVMTHPENADSQGVGALVVFDSARIDIDAPIQTEDMAELFADGSFKLLGRIPTAPLKGCSLKVDEVLVLADETSSKTRASESLQKLGDQNQAEQALSWLRAVISDKEFNSKLEGELRSHTLAHYAMEDLKVGQPKDSLELLEAIRVATIGTATFPKNWLVIPPTTHSVAPLHCLCTLFALGANVTVRLSSILHASPLGSALARACDIAIDMNLLQKTLPSSWRLQKNALPETSIVVFGDDDTVQAIKQLTGSPVVGFGNALAATFFAGNEDLKASTSIVKDNVSLGQRGCMSARLNFVAGFISPKLLEQLTRDFSSALLDMPEPDFSQKAARSLEIVRLSQLGANVVTRQDARWTLAIVTDPKDLSKFVSRLDLVFIFVQCTNVQTGMQRYVSDLKDLRRISASQDPQIETCLNQILSQKTQPIELVKLGTLNAPALNGKHLGHATFADIGTTEVK